MSWCAYDWLRSSVGSAVVTILGSTSALAGQVPAAQQEPLRTESIVTVVGVLPLPGVEVPVTQFPGAVQTVGATDLEASGALDLADVLNRSLNGVHVNEVQSNPFQPDVNYRGYSASPLLGTPQGLSVYMDGVRLNQPFGDVVNWDLIPKMAIESATLMPGANPLFGLNTLGGALSVHTKSGRSFKGTTVQATFGQSMRRSIDVEHGGQATTAPIAWYLAGTLFGEEGWREDSPSDVRQPFGKVSWGADSALLTASGAYANNRLTGNGLQEVRLLEADRQSIYTRPDTTDNRSAFLALTGQRQSKNGRAWLGNLYYRDLATDTLNADINESSLEESIYQPSAVEVAALTAAGYARVPLTGATAANTPFPSFRCIANVLRQDEPAAFCNGLINRTASTQRNGGASGQVTDRQLLGTRVNMLSVGAAFDRSQVEFGQSTQFGYLNADRSVTPVAAFADDVAIDLGSRVTTWSVFMTDTLPVGRTTHLTASGRFNRTTIVNRDRIEPGGGDTSLDGDHVYARFNPSVGITTDLRPRVNLYGSYGESSRAATAIELGCANPEQPCRLPNAMAGDPPLNQVVTRSLEGGLRAGRGRWEWHAGAFLARSADDILFVSSDQTGFGYFTNVDRTARRGFELGAKGVMRRLTINADYTFLRATFESDETLNGSSNSANEDAAAGHPGVEGTIEVEAGHLMPLIPQHLAKLSFDVQATPKLGVHVNLQYTGGVFARGNENNAHEPDGVFYLGDGSTDGYTIVNLGLRYSVFRRFEVIGQMNNLFDRRYVTAAQLGPAGFSTDGAFVAQPFPASNGDYPLVHSTFVSPGAPFRAWGGVRARF